MWPLCICISGTCRGFVRLEGIRGFLHLVGVLLSVVSPSAMSPERVTLQRLRFQRRSTRPWIPSPFLVTLPVESPFPGPGDRDGVRAEGVTLT